MQHLPPLCYKYLPVILSGFLWISSGVLVATTRPQQPGQRRLPVLYAGLEPLSRNLA